MPFDSCTRVGAAVAAGVAGLTTLGVGDGVGLGVGVAVGVGMGVGVDVAAGRVVGVVLTVVAVDGSVALVLASPRCWPKGDFGYGTWEAPITITSTRAATAANEQPKERLKLFPVALVSGRYQFLVDQRRDYSSG